MATKDRRKQLARQRYERQQERRAAQERRARRARVVGGVTAAAVLVGGGVGFATVMGGDDTADDRKGAKATGSQTPAVAAGECAYTPSKDQGARKGLGSPPAKPAYKGTVNATLKTNLGDIGLRLDAAKAPCTVNSFAYLANKNYFDGTRCHRLSTEGALRMLQCGDPTATGTGGPGYQFPDENLPKEGATGKDGYGRGVLAMANAGPGTNGSQFFILYGDSELGPNYTIFGAVTSGLNIVESVAKAGSDGSGQDGTGQPKKKIEFNDVTLADK